MKQITRNWVCLRRRFSQASGPQLKRLNSKQKLWALLVGVTCGLAVGVGGYTFIYAKGASYLTNDPAACANCHIMQEHYSAWIKSSHRAVAVCNDCHTPAGGMAKYANKANNGFWHAWAFTTGRFREPIQLKANNRTVIEAACRKCHQSIIDAIDGPHWRGERVACLRCHRGAGHANSD